MEWILAALAIGVIGLAAAASAGRFGEMPDVVDDRVYPTVPATGRLTGGDIRDVQFAVVPRGYSMEQVDDFLHRVAAQIDLDEPARPVVANLGPRDLE